MDPEAFEKVGDVGRSGEGDSGPADGRLGCVGVRSTSGVVGVDIEEGAIDQGIY